MLVFLVLKNAVECTSQRLKWTSGARVMIIFKRLTPVRLPTLENTSSVRDEGFRVSHEQSRGIASTLHAPCTSPDSAESSGIGLGRRTHSAL